MKIHGLGAVTRLSVLSFALLLLVVPRGCQSTPPPSGTYFVFNNFTINARSSPWLEGWCSVNGVPFLQFHDNKATPLGDLGKVVNATKAWTGFTERQNYIGEELRNQILNTEEEADKTMDHHTWQVIMESQYKQGQLSDASWKFIIGGQNFFYFNPVTKRWGAIHDKAIGIMKKWETNTELAMDLARFSKEDSGYYLKEFSKHWKEIPRLTSKDLDTTQFPSASSLSPTTQSPCIAAFIIMGVNLLVFILA